MRIRNILALFITIISAVPLVAQSDDDIPYEFGLRIAPQISFSSPDSKSLKDGGSSLDWNFGFHVSKKLNDRYAIGTEVNVINMTSKVKFNETMYVESAKIFGGGAYTSDMAINYNLRYLEVPLLFKMRTTPIKNKWRVFGEFGMGFAFLLRSKADVNSSVLKLEDVDVDNPDNADKFKLRDDPTSGENSTKINFMRPSFIIGGGATYDLFGQTKLYAGLRYDGGLYDYMDASKWNATNSFTALNIGIIF